MVRSLSYWPFFHRNGISMHNKKDNNFKWFAISIYSLHWRNIPCLISRQVFPFPWFKSGWSSSFFLRKFSSSGWKSCHWTHYRVLFWIVLCKLKVLLYILHGQLQITYWTPLKVPSSKLLLHFKVLTCKRSP